MPQNSWLAVTDKQGYTDLGFAVEPKFFIAVN